MYSEELENLIDLALADGEITEKEKAVLLRKAKALGVDKDEFEMVLEGRLLLHQQEKDQTGKEYFKIKSINKCANCGEPLRSFELICSACGTEIIGISENKYVKQLSDKIEKMSTEVDKDGDRKYDDDDISKIISNFPIPSTRGDLISFLYFLGPKVKYNPSTDPQLVNAWRIKFEEVGNKLRYMLTDSKDIRDFTDYFNECLKSNLIKRLWYGPNGCLFKIILFGIVIPSLLILLSLILFPKAFKF